MCSVRKYGTRQQMSLSQFEKRTERLVSSLFDTPRHQKTSADICCLSFGFQSPAVPMKRIIFYEFQENFGGKLKLLLSKFQVSPPKVPPHCSFRQVRTRTKMHTCLRLTQCRITFITTTRHRDPKSMISFGNSAISEYF